MTTPDQPQPLPNEAITAAAGAIFDQFRNPARLDRGQLSNLLARAALAAAAPSIRAQAQAELIDSPVTTELIAAGIRDGMDRAVAAERERMRALAGHCPTACDADCEVGDGCHEAHQLSNRRSHQPWACQDLRAVTGAAVAAERQRIGAVLDAERAAARHLASHARNTRGEDAAEARARAYEHALAIVRGEK